MVEKGGRLGGLEVGELGCLVFFSKKNPAGMAGFSVFKCNWFELTKPGGPRDSAQNQNQTHCIKHVDASEFVAGDLNFFGSDVAH